MKDPEYDDEDDQGIDPDPNEVCKKSLGPGFRFAVGFDSNRTLQPCHGISTVTHAPATGRFPCIPFQGSGRDGRQGRGPIGG